MRLKRLHIGAQAYLCFVMGSICYRANVLSLGETELRLAGLERVQGVRRIAYPRA